MNPKLNPDGVSIKGCEIIYAPRGQAGEYSPLATNPYKGCGHKCLYCYVPAVLRMTREDFDAGAVVRPAYLTRLQKDARKYQHLGIVEQVMLSFTTDPYHPGDTTLTRLTLQTLIEHGLGFCTLTKGGSRAIRDLDLFRPTRDAFAASLTSTDNGFATKWERGAAAPDDRIQTLRTFHEAGIFTWVSLEPVLSIEHTLEVIRATHSFVDLFKVGRINYSPLTRRINWRDFTQQVTRLLNDLGSAHYIKHDLQPYLSEGYPNPLRVRQHHGDQAGPTRPQSIALDVIN